MDELRRPFLIAALVLFVVVLALELGATLAFGLVDPDTPPGLAIPYLALVDVLLAFTLALMTAGLIVPEAVLGRVQGFATLILAILVILGGLALIFVALGLLLLMIGLLASFFGAIVYFAVWGAFPRGPAAAILGTILTLKVATGLCLLLAHQRFLENKGLVAIVVTSLILNVGVAFAHALLPGPFVSIADAVVAIIVGIVAIVWAVILLLGAVVSILRIIRIPQLPQLNPARGGAPPGRVAEEGS